MIELHIERWDRLGQSRLVFRGSTLHDIRAARKLAYLALPLAIHGGALELTVSLNNELDGAALAIHGTRAETCPLLDRVVADPLFALCEITRENKP